MIRDPAIFYLIVNTLLAIVIGLVGWLLKRAITANDARLDEAIKDIREVTRAINKLELLIVGDYYPRKEHNEYARQMELLVNGLRENVHDLRDKLQSIAAKVAVLETTISTLKEAHKL